MGDICQSQSFVSGRAVKCMDLISQKVIRVMLSNQTLHGRGEGHELSVIEYTLFLAANQMIRSGTTRKLTFVPKVPGHFQRQYNGPLPPRSHIGLRNRPCH